VAAEHTAASKPPEEGNYDRDQAEELDARAETERDDLRPMPGVSGSARGSRHGGGSSGASDTGISTRLPERAQAVAGRRPLESDERREGGSLAPESSSPPSSAAYTPRDLAEQTLDGTLPYEETWRENAANVLALVDALERIAAIDTAKHIGAPFLHALEIGHDQPAATKRRKPRR